MVNIFKKMMSVVWKTLVGWYKYFFGKKDNDIEMLEMVTRDFGDETSLASSSDIDSDWEIRMIPAYRFVYSEEEGFAPGEYTILDIDLCSDNTSFHEMVIKVEPIHFHLMTKLYALDVDLPLEINPNHTCVSYFVTNRLLRVQMLNKAYEGYIFEEEEDPLIELD